MIVHYANGKQDLHQEEEQVKHRSAKQYEGNHVQRLCIYEVVLGLLFAHRVARAIGPWFETNLLKNHHSA